MHLENENKKNTKIETRLDPMLALRMSDLILQTTKPNKGTDHYYDWSSNNSSNSSTPLLPRSTESTPTLLERSIIGVSPKKSPSKETTKPIKEHGLFHLLPKEKQLKYLNKEKRFARPEEKSNAKESATPSPR